MSEVLYVSFPVEHFTLKQARDWAKLHNYKTGRLRITPKVYRFQQRNRPRGTKQVFNVSLPNKVILTGYNPKT